MLLNRTRLRQIARPIYLRLLRAEHLFLVLLAVLIGLGGGLCAVGFRLLIGACNLLAWQRATYTPADIAGLPAGWKLLAPALGGLLCGLIIYRFAREVRGHGVPEVMEAVAVRGGRIRPRVVLAKMFASAICIGSGGSVGREGPIVQIGSAFGSSLGQWLRLDARHLRTLVACGSAAGIAGTFNAPVAGVLFASEIILGDFGLTRLSPIVIASVMATVVGHYFLGDVPAFAVPTYRLVHVGEFVAYALLGVLAALAAVVFIRSLYRTEDLFERIRLSAPLRAALGGLLIGLIGLVTPHVFGVGYEAIGQALRGQMTWAFMGLLVLAKILAVSITIGSGGSGGIFAPSLFIGAMLGGGLGTFVHSVWPEATGGPGTYALVGMGAVVAAATHAPLTAIVIIFELTGDYKIMLPLMTSSVLATLLATRLAPGSIYTLKLLRRGVDLRGGQDVRVLRHVPVREQMRTDVVTVEPHTPLMPLVSTVVDHPGSSVFVVDAERRLLGVITAPQMRAILANAAAFEPLLIARDVMQETGVPTVRPDDSLADVMQFLSNYRGEVPVVQDGRLVGVVWPEDVIKRYHAELSRRDLAASMASAMRSGPRLERLPAAAGLSVAEVAVPPQFVGRSLGELDVRKRYGVTVLLIRRPGDRAEPADGVAPDARYVFRPDDVILIMGSDSAIRRLTTG